jgi:hypothetical protein
MLAGWRPLLGHSRPSRSAPKSSNVRYASNNDRILRRSKITLSAMNQHRRIGGSDDIQREVAD